jgi:hypothetical protein
MYYAVDHANLLAGDVILTTDPDSTLSGSIRALTNSPFSHAIMCTNPPWCIEAVGFGVIQFMVDRLLVQDRECIKVLRLRDRKLRASEAERAVEWAQDQVSREYAAKDALLALFRCIPRLENGKFFCSQLVAEAYQKAGVNLDPVLSPEKISPGALGNSPELTDITTHCVRTAKPAEILRCTGFLDGGSNPTPVTAEVGMLQEIMRTIRPLLAEVGVQAETFDELLLEIVKTWQEPAPWVATVDQKLSELITASGLYNLWEDVCHFDSDHFLMDVQLFHLLEDGCPKDQWAELREHFEYLLRKRDKTIEEFGNHIKVLWWGYARTRLRSFKLMLVGSEGIHFVLLRQRRCIESCGKLLSDLLK